MARIITMDGDRYIMTVPNDQMWRGISENFPDYFAGKYCILRRQTSGCSVFVNSKHVLPTPHEYASYAKLLEFWAESKQTVIFETSADYLPMLVPVDGMNLPITNATKHQFRNGLIVAGGAAYNKGVIFDRKTPFTITNASFHIGDTCLDNQGSLLSWMWWDGCLVCMDVVGKVRMDDLGNLIAFYDPELL